MNIFNALSEGNGRISETNITSFMSYLLDSSNELNNAFFVFFINLIDKSLVNNKISDLLKINSLNIREQISKFSSTYSVNSQPEFLIKSEKGGSQTPDILVSISNKEGEDIVYFIIENKINKSSKNNVQLKKQFEYFYESEDFDSTKPIYSLLVTPNDKIFESMMFESEEQNHKSVWLKWVNKEDSGDSIESTLRSLVVSEHNAEISPIDPNTQYILKSFIDFLCYNFSKSKIKKGISSTLGGINVDDKAIAKIDETVYILKRFSNKTILVFDEKDNQLDKSVKPILRKINDYHQLGVDLFHSTGAKKNTRVLGRDIINKLNDRK